MLPERQREDERARASGSSAKSRAINKTEHKKMVAFFFIFQKKKGIFDGVLKLESHLDFKDNTRGYFFLNIEK